MPALWCQPPPSFTLYNRELHQLLVMEGKQLVLMKCLPAQRDSAAPVSRRISPARARTFRGRKALLSLSPPACHNPGSSLTFQPLLSVPLVNIVGAFLQLWRVAPMLEKRPLNHVQNIGALSARAASDHAVAASARQNGDCAHPQKHVPRGFVWRCIRSRSSRGGKANLALGPGRRGQAACPCSDPTTFHRHCPWVKIIFSVVQWLLTLLGSRQPLLRAGSFQSALSSLLSLVF